MLFCEKCGNAAKTINQTTSICPRCVRIISVIGDITTYEKRVVVRYLNQFNSISSAIRFIIHMQKLYPKVNFSFKGDAQGIVAQGTTIDVDEFITSYKLNNPRIIPNKSQIILERPKVRVRKPLQKKLDSSSHPPETYSIYFKFKYTLTDNEIIDKLKIISIGTLLEFSFTPNKERMVEVKGTVLNIIKFKKKFKSEFIFSQIK